MIRELKNAKAIFIYQKGCYGCGNTAKRYSALQTYVSRNFLEQKMAGKDIVVPSFQVRRIDYDIAWQDEVKSAEVSLPAVKIVSDKGYEWYSYDYLAEKIRKSKK